MISPLVLFKGAFSPSKETLPSAHLRRFGQPTIRPSNHRRRASLQRKFSNTLSRTSCAAEIWYLRRINEGARDLKFTSWTNRDTLKFSTMHTLKLSTNAFASLHPSSTTDPNATIISEVTTERPCYSKIKRWSKQGLAETTQPHHMPILIQDIAYRLERQTDILKNLQAILSTSVRYAVSSELPTPTAEVPSVGRPTKVKASMPKHFWNPKDFSSFSKREGKKRSTPSRKRLEEEQILKALNKELHNLIILHTDTMEQCQSMLSSAVASTDQSDHSDVSPLRMRPYIQTCKEVYARHALTIETMAEMVIDLRGIGWLDKNFSSQQSGDHDEIQPLVLAFLKSRLMTQLLCDHVVYSSTHQLQNLHPESSTTNSTTSCNRVGRRGRLPPAKPHGAVTVDGNLLELVESSVVEARHLVETLSSSPPPQVFVELEERSSKLKSAKDDGGKCKVIRPWLQYTLMEVLKNSLAITMERQRRPKVTNNDTREEMGDFSQDLTEDGEETLLLPIYIRIEETEQDWIIRIFDQAGGLFWKNPGHGHNSIDHKSVSKTKTDIENCFEFATCERKYDRLEEQQSYAMVKSPVRGLGVGLSLSRIHMQQFGGNLIVEDRPADLVQHDDEKFNLPRLESGVTTTLSLSKDWSVLESDIWND